MGPGWDVSDGRSPKRVRVRAMRGGRSDDDVASCKKADRARCDAMRCVASHDNTAVDGEEKRDAVAEQGEGEGPARTSKSLAE